MASLRICPECGLSFEPNNYSHRRCDEQGCRYKRVKFISKIAGIVRDALQRGELIRQPCEVCGTTKVDAHHDDYGRPLVVRWFCRSHHQLHHSELNRRFMAVAS